MTNELAAWVRAQVDEDEDLLHHGEWALDRIEPGHPDAAAYLRLCDPDRGRAEIAAKRSIIDMWADAECEAAQDLTDVTAAAEAHTLGLVIELIAQVYVGRPGWEEAR